MAVTAGKDYAYARRVSWVFERGVGKALAVATPNNLFVIPYNVVGGSGLTITRTEASIGGFHPTKAVEQLLSDQSTTIAELERALAKWCGEITGSIVTPMSEFKRIVIRTGWFSRGVYLSKKTEGRVHRPGTMVVLRVGKEELSSWQDLFQGDARLVDRFR
ncbi:MAG: hypothetical protein D6806_09630 [Deltaproteobacteria bacterium]|nr:MAG: hypothetical protein D6806_09630 [Deltaproteobacteria bacterium]